MGFRHGLFSPYPIAMPWMLLLGIHRADVHLEPPHHYNVSVLEGSADRVFPPSCRMRRGQRSEWARRRRIQTTGIVKMKSNFDETTDGMVGEFVITSLDQFLRLWSQTYNAEGTPDWSHILPYYNEDIHFIDSVQELRGFRDFKDMVERLARRSGAERREGAEAGRRAVPDRPCPNCAAGHTGAARIPEPVLNGLHGCQAYRG